RPDCRRGDRARQRYARSLPKGGDLSPHDPDFGTFPDRDQCANAEVFGRACSGIFREWLVCRDRRIYSAEPDLVVTELAFRRASLRTRVPLEIPLTGQHAAKLLDQRGDSVLLK